MDSAGGAYAALLPEAVMLHLPLTQGERVPKRLELQSNYYDPQLVRQDVSSLNSRDISLSGGLGTHKAIPALVQGSASNA